MFTYYSDRASVLSHLFSLKLFSNLSPVTTETSIENDKCCNGAQINNSLFPHSCESHSAKQISCLSVDNCSKLLYLEETKVHHLSSISMDWTLLIDRQAANCRNTSDEVFPRIYLGDRYEKYFRLKISMITVLQDIQIYMCISSYKKIRTMKCTHTM